MRILCALALLASAAVAALGQASGAPVPPMPVPSRTATPASPAASAVRTRRAPVSGAGASAAKGSLHAGEASLLSTAFRVTRGGGEIVLQTSAELTLETRGDSSSTSFVLKGCRILRSNDRRPLDTRFFDSPVTGVTIRERGPDVEIDVSVRGQSVATSHQERGPGRTWYWVLTFAPAREGSSSAGRAFTKKRTLRGSFRSPAGRRERASSPAPTRYQAFVARPRAGRTREGRCGCPYQDVWTADARCVSMVKKKSFM